MKIIDEKGKVFGKVNIIDLIILLFLICFLTPLFYFGYEKATKKELPKIIEKEVTKKTSEKLLIDESRYIEVNGVLFGSSPEIVEKIDIGDKELDSNKNVIAEIIGVGKPEKILRKIKVGKESSIIEDTALNLKFKMLTKIQNNHFIFKGRKLLVNQSFKFDTPEYKIGVVFIGKEKKEEEKRKEERMAFKITEEKDIEMQGLLYDVSDTVSKMIKKGDKELDNIGNVIAEIIDIGKPIKILKEINLGRDSIMMETTALSLKLKLRTFIQDNRFVFKGKALLLDHTFEFNTPRYTLNIIFKELKGEREKKTGEVVKESIKEKRIDIADKTIYKRIKLRVRTPQMIPELARLITVGDREYVMGTKKDEQIFILGEVISIVKVTNHKKITIIDGKKQKYERADLRDAEFIVDLRVEEKNNRFMYKSHVIKIGQTFLFDTPEYILRCRILEIIK